MPKESEGQAQKERPASKMEREGLSLNTVPGNGGWSSPFSVLLPPTGVLLLLKDSFDFQGLIITGIVPLSGVSHPEKRVQVGASVSTIEIQS